MTLNELFCIMSNTFGFQFFFLPPSELSSIEGGKVLSIYVRLEYIFQLGNNVRLRKLLKKRLIIWNCRLYQLLCTYCRILVKKIQYSGEYIL